MSPEYQQAIAKMRETSRYIKRARAALQSDPTRLSIRSGDLKAYREMMRVLYRHLPPNWPWGSLGSFLAFGPVDEVRALFDRALGSIR